MSTFQRANVLQTEENNDVNSKGVMPVTHHRRPLQNINVNSSAKKKSKTLSKPSLSSAFSQKSHASAVQYGDKTVSGGKKASSSTTTNHKSTTKKSKSEQSKILSNHNQNAVGQIHHRSNYNSSKPLRYLDEMEQEQNHHFLVPENIETIFRQKPMHMANRRNISDDSMDDVLTLKRASPIFDPCDEENGLESPVKRQRTANAQKLEWDDRLQADEKEGFVLSTSSAIGAQ